MTAKLYVWHRRLALFVMLPLLLFGLSGLLHPVMRLTAPELDQRFFATPSWPDNLPVLSDISDELSLQKNAGFSPG